MSGPRVGREHPSDGVCVFTMTHSDDEGLVLPPKLAPIQVVIVPIAKNAEQLELIRSFTNPMIAATRSKGIKVKFDDDDTKKPGRKFAEHEFKGCPVRIAVGPRDMENGTVEVARRDTLEKNVMQVTDISEKIEHLLQAIQDNLYQKALAMRRLALGLLTPTRNSKWSNRERVGLLLAHWDGTAETEARVKEETKATIRCIPLEDDARPGHCMVTGMPSVLCRFRKSLLNEQQPADARSLILGMLCTKSCMKQDVYRNTVELFEEVKEQLKSSIADDLAAQVKAHDGAAHGGLRRQGRDCMRTEVAGDVIIFHMHTNVFKLDQSHSLWKIQLPRGRRAARRSAS